jgi:hypothetical protein
MKGIMTTFYILLFFVPPSLFSQTIKQDEIDKFTKQRRVETSNTLLKGGLSCGLYTYFRSVDSSYYLTIGGYGCAVGVVGTNDQATFLLDNSITVSVFPTGVQSYEIGDYNKSYRHQYSITLDNIKMLANHKLKSVRRYTSKGYSDIDIPNKNSSELMKLCTLFLTAVTGESTQYNQ